MGRRTGFKRLLIAASIPWFGYWGIVGYFGSQGEALYHDYYVEALARGDTRGAEIWLEHTKDATAGWNAAVTWGLTVPILLVVVAATAFWVRRGFKSVD